MAQFEENNIILKSMQAMSGSNYETESKYNLYNKIIAFQGVVGGVGTSTIVANVACELARRGLTVCVLDTSILAPAQEVLLKVIETTDDDKLEYKKDWLDFSDSVNTRNILRTSSYMDKNIEILSFRDRTIVDLLSTKDTEEVVENAYLVLEKMYDVILVDICQEQTNITTAAAIHSHLLFQVWSDELIAMSNIENYVRNSRIKSMQVDKMRNIILNKNCIMDDDGINSLLKRYGFNKITEIPLSFEFVKKQCSGIPLHKILSQDEEIDRIVEGVKDIADFIMGIKADRGVIDGNDIVNGNIVGTLANKFKTRRIEASKATIAGMATSSLKAPESIDKDELNDEVSLDNLDAPLKGVTEFEGEDTTRKKRRGFFGFSKKEEIDKPIENINVDALKEDLNSGISGEFSVIDTEESDEEVNYFTVEDNDYIEDEEYEDIYNVEEETATTNEPEGGTTEDYITEEDDDLLSVSKSSDDEFFDGLLNALDKQLDELVEDIDVEKEVDKTLTEVRKEIENIVIEEEIDKTLSDLTKDIEEIVTEVNTEKSTESIGDGKINLPKTKQKVIKKSVENNVNDEVLDLFDKAKRK